MLLELKCLQLLSFFVTIFSLLSLFQFAYLAAPPPPPPPLLPKPPPLHLLNLLCLCLIHPRFLFRRLLLHLPHQVLQLLPTSSSSKFSSPPTVPPPYPLILPLIKLLV